MKPNIPDYELIKSIGRGSYGEVWLARSLTGSYLAVKIVSRSNFVDDPGFLREFDGVRRYEPLSRLHPGLVAILHVGRLPDVEAFYYVMELADDVLGTRCENADKYSPDTLAFRIRRDGRLPVDECRAIVSATSSALASIHSSGLIHRDIKLSNIIFVDGRPKLSDPGLVAVSGEAMSYVGTSGYVPPDGPGTMRADVYALGMVLYQMLAGNDISYFPSIPSAILGDENRTLFIQLNRIMLKACGHRAMSYADAQALSSDLAVLDESGHMAWSLHRHPLGAGHIAVAALVVGMVVIMLFVARTRWEGDTDVQNATQGSGSVEPDPALGLNPLDYDFHVRTTNQNDIWISSDALNYFAR